MAGAGMTVLLTTLPLLLGATETDVASTEVDVADLASPCPDVFSYDAQQRIKNSWYGTVVWRLVSYANSFRLDIALDRPANLLGNSVGEVKTKNNVNFTILNQQRRLVPGPTLRFQFFVTYTEGQPPPQVVAVKLNHIEICAGVKAPDPKPTTRPGVTTKPRIPADDEGSKERTTPKPVRVVIPPVYVEDELARVRCGVADVQARPLVTKGQDTLRGEWPWHAALFLNDAGTWAYICGGSLVSPRSVVTAAHCVTSPSGRKVHPTNLNVYLGKYKRQLDSEEGELGSEVMQVTVHPMYNASSYYGDIAVLTLTTRADYTTYIKPVCLWDSTLTDLSYVEERVGTVVGWGFDDKGKLTDDLKLAPLAVVDKYTCLSSFPNFFSKFNPERTFCAGYRNGTSVCNGDSGGGMVFPELLPDGKQRWSLRGVVSVSVAKSVKGSTTVCDTAYFVVFTDVAKYLDFVKGSVIT